MVIHQAPSDTAFHPDAHWHPKFEPACRMRGADVLPDSAAEEVQNVRVDE